MCRACGRRHNSVVEADTSPTRAERRHERGSLESINSGASFTHSWHTGGGSSGEGGGSGGMPVHPNRGSGGMTMKEYDQHLARLNKENFALKLRIYFMEEQQGVNGASSPHLYNNNIDLKVENESLKRQLYDKQQLLSQAATAMTQMEEEYRQQIKNLHEECDTKAKELKKLEEEALQLQKALESRISDLESSQEQPQMTQLCDIAFPNDSWSSSGSPVRFGETAKKPSESFVRAKEWVQRVEGNRGFSTGVNNDMERKMSGGSDSSAPPPSYDPLHINTTNVTNNNINNTLPNTSNNLQQMQYQNYPPNPFSSEAQQPYYPPQYGQGTGATVFVVPVPPGGESQVMVPGSTAPGKVPEGGKDRIRQLEAELQILQNKLMSLQHELHSKEMLTGSLQAQIDALMKELQEKERDVVEREEKLETISQELETRHREIQTRDDQITTLHGDLDRVTPEISVKVQEIVERDRIIEEKIEQIEQQNKILVEIQITLDEKQKQIAELESNLNDAREKCHLMEKDYDKSCEAIQALVGEKESKDKDIIALKKELKRRDRKIKDLVAELKETLDSLAKAKWEAETGGCGGEDSVKEMVEEENERLWADVEQKKLELQNLKADLSKALEDKSSASQQLESCKTVLSDMEAQIEALTVEASTKEAQLLSNAEAVEALKTELQNVSHELGNKKIELESLKKALPNISEGELKNLKLKLEKLEETQAQKDLRVQGLQNKLELKESQIQQLESQLKCENKVKNGTMHPPVTQVPAPVPLHVNISTGISDFQQPLLDGDSKDRTNSIHDFQKQVECLRAELQTSKNAMGLQIQELGNKKSLREIVSKYRNEVLRLRKRLSESNNNCTMLRERLEELADFLERILELEDQGLIDISKMSGFNRDHLNRTLNDSRNLSQTLSMSAIMDLDSELCEEALDEEGYEEHHIQLILPEMTINDTTNASCLRDSMLEVTRMGEGNGEYQQLVAKLCLEVEQKTNKLDEILLQVANMSQEIERKEQSLNEQTNLLKDFHQNMEKMDKINKDTQSEEPEVATVECQTLLAMAPRQSNVSSLADLTAPYLSSCSESLVMMRETSANNTSEEVTSSKFLPLEKSVTKPPSNLRPGYASINDAPIQPGCASANEAATQAHHAHVPVSPSESEAWSEPDRHVSLARIGLETCTLAASLDRSLSRSRPTRVSAQALSSESDTEECPLAIVEENALLFPSSRGSLPMQSLTPTKSVPKRRSDASEVRRLTTKLRALEHLNDTLKAELNIYQSLSHQLSPTTDQQQSDSRSSLHSFGDTSDIPRPSFHIDTGSSCRSLNGTPLPLKKFRRFTTATGLDEETTSGLALAAPLLQEIRSLRTKLEESISNNDQLRDQLEAAVLSCSRASDDPSHLTHLTAALLNAQETLQLTREKLAFAQRCEQVQADRCALAEKRAEEDNKQCEALRSHLKEAQQQLGLAEQKYHHIQTKCDITETKLSEAHKIHEKQEAMLQERLDEVSRACEESEARLQAQHDAISEVYSSVQETSGQMSHVAHLHSALQASESQILRVTRDRLLLLGEKSKLQAQLMSAQAQTCLLQDSLSEDQDDEKSVSDAGRRQSSSKSPVKQITTYLPLQLAQVQSAVKNLQAQCSRLQTANLTLTRQRDQLHEKLAGYKAVEKLSSKPDITLETVSSEGGKNNGSSPLKQLQKNHNLLQEDYTHLQNLYSHLQESEKELCKQLHSAKLSLEKSETSLATLTQQYQERLQLVQNEWSERLTDAEEKLVEAQHQFKVSLIEEKLSLVQNQYEQKLEELKKTFENEIEGRNRQLKMAESNLHSERNATAALKSELNKMRGARMPQLSVDSAIWSENKENLHSHTIRYREYPSSPSGRSSGIPMRTTNSGLPPSPRNNKKSPQHLLSRSPQNPHYPSDGRGLSLPYYNITADDEITFRNRRTSDSSDLGLGSSDNGGGASSLERFVSTDGRGRHIPVLVTERNSLPAELPVYSSSCSVPGHLTLAKTNSRLVEEVEDLQRQLSTKDARLATALQQLESANVRKQTVEKAIYRELSKTHQVLKSAKGNMKHHAQRTEPMKPVQDNTPQSGMK